MYFSLGKINECAHDGKYSEYLKFRAPRRFLPTGVIADITVNESVPRVPRNNYTGLLADHGRGGAPIAWKSHAQNCYIPGTLGWLF